MGYPGFRATGHRHHMGISDMVSPGLDGLRHHFLQYASIFRYLKVAR